MEDFEFDFDFLDQDGENVSETAERDFVELSQRIEDTNNLVIAMNFLKNENESLKKQLEELNCTVKEVEAMYQQENLRANTLKRCSEMQLSRLSGAEAEISNLKVELMQKRLYYNQVNEELKTAKEKEKKQNHDFRVLKDNFQTFFNKFPTLQMFGEDSTVEAFDVSAVSTEKRPTTVKCDYSQKEMKKRDSNRATRMVSRGTQYQYSTTTRSTCTSAFIRKHSVAVNFPEVIPIAVEDIFKETVVDIPTALSPIQDVLGQTEDAQVQTDSFEKSCRSIGTCTNLSNVRRDINFISGSKHHELTSKHNSNWNKLFASELNEATQPHLSEVWNLLGQTIFALIDTNALSTSKRDAINSKISQIDKSLTFCEFPTDYNDILTSDKFLVENVPKAEKNSSFCRSPNPDTPYGVHPDDKSCRIVVNCDDFQDVTIDKTDSNCIRKIYNTCDGQTIDVASPEKYLKSNQVDSSANNDLMHGDSVLATIKEEMELLERKTHVISPIRNRETVPITKNQLFHISNQVCAFHTVRKDNAAETNLESKGMSNDSMISMNAGMSKESVYKKLCGSQLQKKRKKSTLKSKNRNVLQKSEKIRLMRSPGPNTKKKGVNAVSEGKNLDTNGNKTLISSLISAYTEKMYNKAQPKELKIGNKLASKKFVNLSRDEKFPDQIKNSTKRQTNTLMMNIPEKICPEISTCSSKINLRGFAVQGLQKENGDHIFSNLHSGNQICFNPALGSDENDFYGFGLEYCSEQEKNVRFSPQYESPKSPDSTASEDEANPKPIPLERVDENNADCSPASPFFKQSENSLNPTPIPLQRMSSGISNYCNKLPSLLEKCIRKYKSDKYRSCVHKLPIKTATKKNWLLRKIIEKYLIEARNQTDCLKYAKQIARRFSRYTNVVCDTICEVIEDTEEGIDKDFTPPTIVMTTSHQKVILLIKSLEKYMNRIEKKLLFTLEQRIFVLKSDNVKLKPLINLFLMYLGLIDTQNMSVNPARLIIYKSLYYYNRLAFPMIYYILVSYPNVIPGNDETQYEDKDPLVYTIQAILNSQEYNVENKDLKYREMYHILRLYYKYEHVKPSREEVVEYLINKIRSDQLRNVSFAFALLCKRNGVKWTLQNVLDGKLLPILKEYTSQLSKSNQHDKKVSCILNCVSAILKPFPVNSDISFYRKLFVSILYATNRQVVQEAAALGILRVSRFGYDECFLILYPWNPAYRISEVLRLSMETFVHRCTLNKLKGLAKRIHSIF